MSILRFTIRDGDNPPQTFDFDFDRPLMLSEAEACENKTGWTRPEWSEALFQERSQALKFALWLAMTRAGESPDWATLDLEISDECVDWSDFIEAMEAARAADQGEEEGPTGPAPASVD